MREHVEVVTKRNETKSDRYDSTNSPTNSRMMYYATFEDSKSGNRTEFHISAKEYRLLEKGDNGVLIHKGTRFKGFECNTKQTD